MLILNQKITFWNKNFFYETKMSFRVKNDDLSLKCEFRDKNVNSETKVSIRYQTQVYDQKCRNFDTIVYIIN